MTINKLVFVSAASFFYILGVSSYAENLKLSGGGELSAPPPPFLPIVSKEEKSAKERNKERSSLPPCFFVCLQ